MNLEIFSIFISSPPNLTLKIPKISSIFWCPLVVQIRKFKIHNYLIAWTNYRIFGLRKVCQKFCISNIIVEVWSNFLTFVHVSKMTFLAEISRKPTFKLPDQSTLTLKPISNDSTCFFTPVDENQSRWSSLHKRLFCDLSIGQNFRNLPVANINVTVLVPCLKSVNCGKGNFRNYGFYSSCHMWSGKFWKSRKISKMSVSLANIGLLQIRNWSIWIYFDPFNPEKWSSSSIVRKNTGSEI